MKTIQHSVIFFFISVLCIPSAYASDGSIDAIFGQLNGVIASVFFFDVMPSEASMPFIVAWLMIGGVYLTLRFGFINIRMMGHALAIIRGKYTSKDDKGEISSFQALTSALSATVGLGNIAGVAIAIGIGGPGATFWMIVAGFFAMTLKFTEVTLAQMYREFRPNGHVMGGAMQYLSKGFAEKGMTSLGKGLAMFFAMLCIFSSLGGGNAFQLSQAMGAVQEQLPFFQHYPLMFGILMATAVGVVIIGGIRRIAHAAEAIVPSMVAIYLSACLWIIFTHASEIPNILGLIVHEAFAPAAVAGGIIGVIVQGFKRAAFSSEAGIGSAAIAHSAASVKYPVRQGLVALYEPFIDTIVICTMTALVIVITGVYQDPQYAHLIHDSQGAALTSAAFGSVIGWFPIILSISVVLFAYSTMISWSYYGERCWTYMLGERFSMLYRILFVAVIVLASVTSAGNILDFSDLMLLSMALPNLIALYVLQDKVALALKTYLHQLHTGELDQELGRNRDGEK
ncbi:MAG: alanine/glycine:cation symporter family protein [Mariprofundaceae bacterium]|nr:alanine/glycine:cation symporter family protein [Mariprofundaceae bacterium]